MGPKYTVQLRRKREQKTNYRRRLALLKSEVPRLVIRKTLSGVIVQLVQYQPAGDVVLASATSAQLKKYGLTVINGNIPVCYLTGVLIAKIASAKKIKEVVVDVGLQKLTPQSKIYATVAGAKVGGLHINLDEKILPQESRLLGGHIESYAKLLKADAGAYQKQFGALLKANIDPTQITSVYKKVKEAVLK
jgi:large subunit ribosomal protein L18